MSPLTSAIFGCEGPVLTSWEEGFFRETRPWGYIIFGRNVESRDQLRRLCDDLRAASDDPDALVFVDQEGGPVARLKTPLFRHPPAPRLFAELYRTDPEAAEEAMWLNALLMAEDMRRVGINANCAPMLDVVRPDAHEFLQRRALGDDIESVETLGKAMALGLRNGGVVPCIKHAPGHGAADCDSHFNLPHVTLSKDELERTDFAPFKALLKEPMLMTSHIVYPAIDPDHPATQSAAILQGLIRGDWGYDGLILSDDLNMKALGGSMEERCSLALDAGVDILCHCNGEAPDMQAVARAARPLDGVAADRAKRARSFAAEDPKPFDREAAEQRLRALSLFEVAA
ncbi:MAG: beta-N-acetylhexosaminidase [Parvularcula sp.]|jgi:beta-N-acetylhexosaminidase|nr:beta-N-acetylhexosaminidase [Parvularcula sp.]